jgi:hypothetical protein
LPALFVSLRLLPPAFLPAAFRRHFCSVDIAWRGVLLVADNSQAGSRTHNFPLRHAADIFLSANEAFLFCTRIFFCALKLCFHFAPTFVTLACLLLAALLLPSSMPRLLT